MPAVKFFFLGFAVDEALADGLGRCEPSERTFLEDPMYLEMLSAEGNNYIGRRMDASVSLEQAEDTARNVRSLISLVVPAWKTPSSAAELLALEEVVPGRDILIAD